MRILIPKEIQINVDNVESLFLEIAPNIKNCVPKFVTVLVPIEDIFSKWTGLHNQGFEGAKSIQYRVFYKNGTIEIFRFFNKNDSLFNPNDKNSTNFIRIKYKNSEKFKSSTEILSILDKNISNINCFETEPKGQKNLIYFTVYFNNGYIELLNNSIETILKHSSINFDILIITDEQTKLIIENQPFVKKITPLYHITPTPLDGVEASSNKTLIFNYSNINDYNKILFLDCDVIAINDINKIFNLNLEQNTLYTAYNLNLTYKDLITLFHGFEFLSEDFVREMEAAKQMPFNAGQFLFCNSNRMKLHFDNLNWLINNWNGEYFFEQCFMNYYFCKAKITECTLLQNHASIINTIDSNMQFDLNKNTCLVHFIAPPLDAKTKLDFIKNFANK